MPHGIKDWAISIAFSAVLAFVWRWLAKLAENAMLTWSDDQIAYFFGFSSPEASTVISWVIPIILGIATILAYHVVQSRISTHKATNTAIADNSPAQEIAPRQLPKAAHERIPLLDIIEMARKAGWNINAYRSNDPSELTAQLNQAAADGTIKFWGRKYEYDLGETAVTNFPLIEIPAEHFTEFSFQPLNLFRDQQKNFYIFTGKLGRQPGELRGRIYRDIHACPAQLNEWMSRNAKG